MNSLLLVLLLSVAVCLHEYLADEWSTKRRAIFRARRSFKSLRAEYGTKFNQVYRMKYWTFKKLLRVIGPKLETKRRWTRNGVIATDIRLCCSSLLRWRVHFGHHDFSQHSLQ